MHDPKEVLTEQINKRFINQKYLVEAKKPTPEEVMKMGVDAIKNMKTYAKINTKSGNGWAQIEAGCYKFGKINKKAIDSQDRPITDSPNPKDNYWQASPKDKKECERIASVLKKTIGKWAEIYVQDDDGAGVAGFKVGVEI